MFTYPRRRSWGVPPKQIFRLNTHCFEFQDLFYSKVRESNYHHVWLFWICATVVLKLKWMRRDRPAIQSPCTYYWCYRANLVLPTLIIFFVIFAGSFDLGQSQLLASSSICWRKLFTISSSLYSLSICLQRQSFSRIMISSLLSRVFRVWTCINSKLIYIFLSFLLCNPTWSQEDWFDKSKEILLAVLFLICFILLFILESWPKFW